MRFFLMCFLSGSVIMPVAAAADIPPQELHKLVQAAMAYNPAVRAARQRFHQALARYRGERGFYDPRLVASTAAADEMRSIPGVRDGVTATAETTSIEGGVDKAFAPGFYAGVGAAERQLRDAGDDEEVYQTLIGAQLRIPLWRDFAFREQTLTERRAWATCGAAYSQYVTTCQQLWRDVTLAYIGLQEAHSLLLAGESALERVQDLQREAKELVRLQVVPEYQLNQARLEVNLREDELLAARELLKVARVQLTQLTGVTALQDLTIPTPLFVGWAEAVAINDSLPPAEVYPRRGDWQELANLIQASVASTQLAQEQLKPAVYLKTSVTYQGESVDGAFGDSALLDDDKVGGAVELVYSQPLGYRRERAALSAEKAATNALREEQHNLEIDIRAKLEAAEIAFDIGRQRLQIAARAVEAAQATLDAEAERFRLGEGRSRQVLDAEKDLTATLRLQARNAARVLRAQTEHAFETGYTNDALLVDEQRRDSTDQGTEP